VTSMQAGLPDIARIGVWGTSEWLKPEHEASLVTFAQMIDDLGFGSLWISAGFQSGMPTAYRTIVECTSQILVASGILSIWHCSPEQVIEAIAEIQKDFPDRFMLGLGASHAPQVTSIGHEYAKPYSRMVEYLDQLDHLNLGGAQVMLAALGPRMLKLAADRTMGAHPYFVPVEHTRQARAILGPSRLLVPEQAIVLNTDPTVARHWARAFMAPYLQLPNYTNNLQRFGYTEDEFAHGGSDRLVDAIVAWGTPEDALLRASEHLNAGASSVCLRVVTDESAPIPHEQMRVLAELLTS
jgi:probable F420-dependent oxidoreductase